MLTYPAPQAGGPLPAFHSTPLNASHVPQYMGAPPSSGNLKPPVVPTSSIAKPTPISMGQPHPGSKVPLTKVVTGQMDKDSAFTSTTSGGKPLKGSPQGGVVKILAGSEGGVKGDGLVLSQPYYPTSVSLLNSPSNSLSKILMTSSSVSSPSSSQEPMAASSPGANSHTCACMSMPLSSLSCIAGSKPPPTATGGFPAVLSSDAYAVRSPGMAPPIPATSGQPSSNGKTHFLLLLCLNFVVYFSLSVVVSFADTRLDRPPQPSAPHIPVGPGKELTQQQMKERLTTAEVASNIIISNPGLTGKHIAAMTNSTQSQPSPLLPHSAYSSPIISQAGISSAELLPPPGHALLNLPLNQHMVDPASWGFPPQHNSNHMFHNALSSPVSMATGLGGGAGQEVPSQQSSGGGGSGGLKSRLESTLSSSLPQSPLQGGSGPPGPGGGEQAVPSSPSQVNSIRPRILRGKRSVDG